MMRKYQVRFGGGGWNPASRSIVFVERRHEDGHGAGRLPYFCQKPSVAVRPLAILAAKSGRRPPTIGLLFCRQQHAKPMATGR